jgi:tetratricopeptide (TPR) repeat protein
LRFGIGIGLYLGESPIDPKELREDVRELYEKYRKEFITKIVEEDDYGNERRFDIYEWFTKDTGKVFYVGKGTGARYNHIISDMKRSKGICYKELQENFGIDYRIIANELTNIEAEIYEICWIHERTSQGEVLLNFVDMPSDLDLYELTNEKFKTRNFTPEIIFNDYRRRYFSVTEKPDFDSIDQDALLLTHFLYSDSFTERFINQEKEEIRKWIEASLGRVYESLAKGAKSVIVFNILDYDKYHSLKEKGYKIYHSFHVLDYIRSREVITPYVVMNKNKTRVPKVYSALRDELRSYLQSIDNEINEIISKNKDGFEPQMTGLDYKKAQNYKEAIKYLEASVRMKWDTSATYMELSKIYRKFGMLNEELHTLKLALENVNPEHANLGEFTDRINKVLKMIEIDTSN